MPLIGLSFLAQFCDLASCLASSSALSSLARVWLPPPARPSRSEDRRRQQLEPDPSGTVLWHHFDCRPRGTRIALHVPRQLCFASQANPAVQVHRRWVQYGSRRNRLEHVQDRVRPSAVRPAGLQMHCLQMCGGSRWRECINMPKAMWLTMIIASRRLVSRRLPEGLVGAPSSYRVQRVVGCASERDAVRRPRQLVLQLA